MLAHALSRRRISLVFGLGAVAYLFMAGMGAGCFIAQFLCDCFYTPVASRPYDMQLLRQKALIVSLVLMCVASLLLVFDLTVPQKFLLVFRRPFDSILSSGAWLILLFVVFLVLQSVFYRTFSSPAPFARGIEALGAVLALGVAFYTGMLLMSMRAVSLWESVLVVAIFGTSSLSSGLALYVLMAAFFLRVKRLPARIAFLSRLDSILLFAEACLIAWLLAAQYAAGGAACESVTRLLSGDLAWAFWVMLVCVGLVFPLACSFMGKICGEVPLAVMKGVAVCVGCFFLRYCIMEAGIRSFSLA